MWTYRGVNYQYDPRTVMTDIKTSDYSHQLQEAQFQARQMFYEVQYPYWQYPYNIGPPSQQVIKVVGAGTYYHQSNLGLVGRPRGINDWNTPLQTPYGVPLDELG